jgi:hypothetical protein
VPSAAHCDCGHDLTHVPLAPADWGPHFWRQLLYTPNRGWDATGRRPGVATVFGLLALVCLCNAARIANLAWHNQPSPIEYGPRCAGCPTYTSWQQGLVVAGALLVMGVVQFYVALTSWRPAKSKPTS